MDQNECEASFFLNATTIVLGNWIGISDVLSSIHLCEVQLSNCVCQIVGIADLGYLLGIFMIRSKWFNTPWVGTIHRDCDAPNLGCPLTTYQLAENLYVSYHETHT